LLAELFHKLQITRHRYVLVEEEKQKSNPHMEAFEATSLFQIFNSFGWNHSLNNQTDSALVNPLLWHLHLS